MARKRMATASVYDHKNPRDLIPTVLRFDKVAFPYPADRNEWSEWRERWDPELLERCLLAIPESAIPVDWGKAEREAYRINRKQDIALADIELLTGGPLFREPRNEEERWEDAKSRTRSMLANWLRPTWGIDYWIVPSYRSRAEMQQHQVTTLASPSSDARAESLSLLMAHELEVPESADAMLALRLAGELAQDSAFQKSRRALNNWEESLLTRTGTVADDAVQFADLISDLNASVHKHGAERRKVWLFTLMKTPVRVVEAVNNPISAVNSVLEIIEVGGGGRTRPDGPTAVFFDVRERVIKPSQSRHGFWDVY
jgi:hypothetical protein